MLIAKGWKLYRLHFPVILGLVLTIGVPCQLLLNYLAYHVLSQDDIISLVLATVLINCIFGVVISGGILHALFIAKLERRAGFLECFSAAITNWLPLAVSSLLAHCLVFLGLLAFILPGLVFLIRLCLTITIVITEGSWGLAALQRSLKLTADRSWKVITLGLLLILPLQLVLPTGARMLLTIPALNSWQMAAALGVLLTLAGGLITTSLFCLYEELVADESREV